MEGILLGGSFCNNGNLFDIHLQDCLQEILGDIHIAENLAEHEIVGDVQFFVGLHFEFVHFYISLRNGLRDAFLNGF